MVSPATDIAVRSIMTLKFGWFTSSNKCLIYTPPYQRFLWAQRLTCNHHIIFSRHFTQPQKHFYWTLESFLFRFIPVAPARVCFKDRCPQLVPKFNSIWEVAETALLQFRFFCCKLIALRTVFRCKYRTCQTVIIQFLLDRHWILITMIIKPQPLMRSKQIYTFHSQLLLTIKEIIPVIFSFSFFPPCFSACWFILLHVFSNIDSKWIFLIFFANLYYHYLQYMSICFIFVCWRKYFCSFFSITGISLHFPPFFYAFFTFKVQNTIKIIQPLCVRRKRVSFFRFPQPNPGSSPV